MVRLSAFCASDLQLSYRHAGVHGMHYPITQRPTFASLLKETAQQQQKHCVLDSIFVNKEGFIFHTSKKRDIGHIFATTVPYYLEYHHVAEGRAEICGPCYQPTGPNNELLLCICHMAAGVSFSLQVHQLF